MIVLSVSTACGALPGGSDTDSQGADQGAPSSQTEAAPAGSPTTGAVQAPTNAPVTANPTQQAVAENFSLPRLGSEDAEVVIYEFSDYRCPFCRQFTVDTKPELVETYIADDGPVALVYVDFPLGSHGLPAVISAEAAHCAGEQGDDQYWVLHDAIFERFGEMNDLPLEEEAPSVDFLVDLSDEMGMDAGAMRECVESQRYRPVVGQLFRQAAQDGIELTPTFIVVPQGEAGPGGQEMVLGAASFEDFQPYIERALSRARGTQVPTPTPESTAAPENASSGQEGGIASPSPES